MRPQLLFHVLVLLLPWFAVGATAQEAAPPETLPPITLVYVEGRVDAARASGVQPAQAPDLLEEDDRLVTGDGRAELAFAGGARVHLDRDTDARVDLGVRLRVVRGRIIIHTPRDSGPLEVATPAGVVRMEPGGEYELAARDLDGDTVISAIEGRAALEDGDRDVPIATDDEARFDPRDRRPRWARAAPPDEFRHWVEERVEATTRAARDYGLPAPLAPYASQFARHGEWTSVPPYGQVWMPAAAPGWRPYTNGEWRFTRYGWTWIDLDPWAWPVHHFGRWGHHDLRGWFWIPQRTWGPAWVGWAIAADHVAWSPLGVDARPVVDFFAGARQGHVNAWADSWSILPRRHFGLRTPVNRHLEDPRGLPGPVLGGFVSQLVGPRGPAGAYDRYAARASRGAWTGSGSRSEAGGRDRQNRGEPRRDLPESFGSAAPARAVGGASPRPVQRPVPRWDSTPRADAGDQGRRPGDARPADGASGAGVQTPPEQGQLPDGRMRRPNAIRPRYEPPVSSTPADTAAPPAAVPERGSDGARERARTGGGVQRRDRPGEPSGGASGGTSGAVERGEGRPAPRAAPAQRPGQRGEGASDPARRRPR